MTYDFLQQYWWFLISLLGALLAFMMFVQGANSMINALGGNDAERRMIVNSTGRKWELTFTTLVTFGGAFFASFPLFYSTSFGGAYWLWMLILFTFVLQAVSYEFQNKPGNRLGANTFRRFLFINGTVGPFLIGVALSTLFNGAEFTVGKMNITGFDNPIISRWTGGGYGLEALLDVWNIIFGLAVMFLAQVTGALYIINNVDNENVRCRASVRLVGSLAAFLLFFVTTLVHILLKEGYAYDPATGVIHAEPYKYLTNMITLWPLAVLLLAGVALFLYGSARTIISKTYTGGIWPTGIGTVLAVLALLLCAGLNETAYYPSLADMQSSLTIANSCSSEFTLGVMSVVSLLIPFVLAYIAYVWRVMDSRKITEKDIDGGEAY